MGKASPKDDPAFMPGDVGLAEVPLRIGAGSTARPRPPLSHGNADTYRLHLFGAIRTPGGRWAVKASNGLSAAPLRAVAVWRLPGETGAARNALLVRFLRAATATEFLFGEWDCAMAVANWVREATGRDPGAALRGRYRTRLVWMRKVAAAGSLEALFARELGAIGLARVL